MIRNLNNLMGRTFDVLVIGCGIHGALAAWDAALRGLSVALIERGDFGGVTSQNSLRIIHGGLRYLQDGNPLRVRSMARERTTWMKIAPHLVHPMRCLMPTFQKPTRSRLAMGVALAVNDLLSFDRNRLDDPEKFLPGGRILSSEECARLLPGYERSDMTGGAVWHDGHVYNSERLLLEFVLSAADAGAQVANYVEAVCFTQEGERITGVQARDVLTGEGLTIQARLVINSSGAWVGQLLGTLTRKPAVQSEFALSIAMDLIVNQVWAGCAAGVPSQPGGKRRSQMLFIVPWRNKSMIGTWHIPWPNPPDTFKLKESVIQEFLDEINSANPRLNLTLSDVEHVHWGFLPVDKTTGQNGHVRLAREGRVVDHQKEDGLSGLLSMIGVKYTTARMVAEQAVDLAVSRLDLRGGRRCATHTTPVLGGRIERFDDFLAKVVESAPAGLDSEVVEHLVYSYGSQYNNLFGLIQEQPELAQRLDPEQPVIAAEVVHAIRGEMAQRLLDVIQRRTELGTTGLPSLCVLQACALIMRRELGWNDARVEKEIVSVLKAYPLKLMERSAA